MKNSTTDKKLTRSKWFWGLFLTTVLLTFLNWVLFGVISLTRTIPGWGNVLIEQSHDWFLAFAWATGILTTLVILFGCIFVFNHYRTEQTSAFIDKLQLLGYTLGVLVAYLISLAFAWGYDVQSKEGQLLPYSAFFELTVFWLIYNFVLTISALLVTVFTFTMTCQFMKLWPYTN